MHCVREALVIMAPSACRLCLQMDSHSSVPVNPDVKWSSPLHSHLKPHSQKADVNRVNFTKDMGLWGCRGADGRRVYSTTNQMTRMAVGTSAACQGNFHWSLTHFS